MRESVEEWGIDNVAGDRSPGFTKIIRKDKEDRNKLHSNVEWSFGGRVRMSAKEWEREYVAGDRNKQWGSGRFIGEAWHPVQNNILS